MASRTMKRLARFNRYVTNPIGRLVAGRLIPSMVVVVHRGRRSGRLYETPLWAFAGDRELVIALVYGADADWVKNLIAAGGGTVKIRGRMIPTGAPVIETDLSRLPAIPANLRRRLRNVEAFLRLPLVSPLPG